MARRDPAADDPALGSVDPVHHPPIRFAEPEWAWFLNRCAALGVAGASERRSVLEAVFGHLIGVNRWLNLTTVVEPRAWLKQHLLDSLTGLADSRLRHLSEGSPCLDLGSGGGYPGIPLALWTPRMPWVLADARRKKAEFLAAAAKVTGLPRLTARHLRGGEVERAAPELHRKCQLVTSRAMGAGDEVLAEAAPLIHHHGHCLLFKGPSWLGGEREAALAAAPRCGFRFVAERAVVLEDGDPPRLLVCFQRV